MIILWFIEEKMNKIEASKQYTDIFWHYCAVKQDQNSEDEGHATRYAHIDIYL